MPMISNFAKHASKTVGAFHQADKICSSTHLPAPEVVGEKAKKVTAAYTTGCGGETMFSLPVDGDEGGDFERPGPATVCVVDDMAYMFPRYGGDDFEVEWDEDE
jgi:hypothetical protein